MQSISPDHLRTLYDITTTINSSLDFDEVLNTVMDSVMQATRAERGFLLINDDAGALQVVVARGDSSDGTTYSTTVVSQVVESGEPLLTNNAQGDGRYSASQSIIIRGLRSVLCAPMIVKGRSVGAIYVDSSLRAGTFSESDLSLLSAVAGQAAVAIENARLYRVAVEKGRLEREMQMAREIQLSLMPKQMPHVPGYELAASWRAARDLAGDFYDIFTLPGDLSVFTIGDVSDKGAPAALFMASARSMIRSHAFAGFSPIDTIRQTNELLVLDSSSGMFVTAYHTLLNPSGGTIHVNAGHNPPLLCRPGQGVTLLPRGGRAIGMFPNNPVHEIEIQLVPGDALVYYTDGLIDATNANGEMFGEERFSATVLQAVEAGLNAESIKNAVVREVDAFCRDEPAFDDLTLCVLRYMGQ